MPALFPAALLPALDDAGASISGAKLAFFLTGTTTPRAVYSGPTLAVSLGSVVTADSAGRWPDIWLDTTVQYKVQFQRADSSIIKTVDPVNLADTSVSLSIVEQVFTGNGSQTAFVMANVAATSAGQLQVFVNGVYQPISGAYSISSDGVNTTVTLTAAPESGVVVHIRYLVVQGARGDTGPASAITWAFATSTADGDPGAGAFRLNNATLSAVTQIFLDNLSAFGSVDVSAFVDAWGSSSSASKGFLVLRSQLTPGNYAVYRITAAPFAASGYRKVTVSHVASAGTWIATEVFSIEFSAIGDKGDAGSGGATYAADIGNGVATSFALTHGLGTRDLSVSVRRNSGAYDVVLADTELTDADTVTVRTVTAPSAAQYRVIVQRTS